MYRVGVDILHVPRIQALLRRHASYADALPRRILTSLELSDYRALPDHQRLRFLCTRWTLKEAAWKASRPYPASWKDCTVHTTRSGAPELWVKEDIPLSFQCSVSHDGEYCIAYVHTTQRTGHASLRDKRGTGEMEVEHGRDVPRHHDKAEEWLTKW